MELPEGKEYAAWALSPSRWQGAQPLTHSTSPTHVCWMNLCYYSYRITAKFISWTRLGSGKVCNYCLSWWEGLGLYYLFLQKQLELFRNSFSVCIKNHPNTPASLAASLGGLHILLLHHSSQPTWLWMGLTRSLEDPFYTVILIFKTFFSRHNEKLTQGSSFNFGDEIRILTAYCLGTTLPQSDSGDCSRTRFYWRGSLTPFRINILIFE